MGMDACPNFRSRCPLFIAAFICLPWACGEEGSQQSAVVQEAATQECSNENDDADRVAEARALEAAIEFSDIDAANIFTRFSQVTDKKRPVFTKTHGCARAEVIIGKLDPQYSKGMFSNPTASPKSAWVRISSDTRPTVPDQDNSTVGFALKVLGVPGEKLIEGEKHFPTHDFLLQNHHVFFVDTAKDFMEFTASIFTGKLDEYKLAHPDFAKILDVDMTKVVENVRSAQFHSTTPFRLGMEDFVKYRVISCEEVSAEPPPALAVDANYLATRFARDVKDEKVDVCFLLQAQLRTGEMPLDKASVEWPEKESSFHTLATIKIPTQELKDNAGLCEKMSFTTWHALPEHKPVGSVNEARGIVYKAISDLRHQQSGQPAGYPNKDGVITPGGDQ